MHTAARPDISALPSPPPDNRGWPWTEAHPLLPETMPDGGSWPRISIITPSYNQGQFIEETIRAILLQGYPNLEYIIVDGASTDASIEIIKRYESWLSYWSSEPDRGQSHAINTGFQHATGDLITFCNSDDYYLPGTLADVALAYRANPEVGAITGGFMFVGKTEDEDDAPRPAQLQLDSPYDLTLGPPGIYRIHQAATFFTRRALDEVGRYVDESLHYTMDRELLYRVCRLYHVYISKATYGAFRFHLESKSRADIAPFSREFAALYQRSMTGHPARDRKRRRMARHHRARGYLKLAQENQNPISGFGALLAAAFYLPVLLMRAGYWGRWLRLLGLRRAARV